MATPTLSRHALDGVLGPIAIDVRAADRAASLPAVVVLPGFKGFKAWGMFPPLAERLARAGFVVASVDVSGAGVDEAGRFAFPERFGHNTYTAELDDVRRVLDALAAGRLDTAPPRAIGMLGHSRGGGMAILHAAHDGRIRALVTWAAIGHAGRWPSATVADWRARGVLDVVNARTGEVLPLYPDVLDDLEAHRERLDIGAAAAAVTVPWLLVHGDADEAVPIAEAEALHAARPDAELLRLAGGGHTFGARHPWAGSTPALDDAMTRSTAWFARHLT